MLLWLTVWPGLQVCKLLLLLLMMMMMMGIARKSLLAGL
jgi:hypothetical protein